MKLNPYQAMLINALRYNSNPKNWSFPTRDPNPGYPGLEVFLLLELCA